MSSQQSDRHGPAVDDQLQHESGALTHGAPDDGRTEGRRDQIGGVEGPDLAVHRDEDDKTLDRRSRLARAVEPSWFPATGAELVAAARDANRAPEAVDAFGSLPPEQRFETFGEVWDALEPSVATSESRPSPSRNPSLP